jgi:hypothetical protein
MREHGWPQGQQAVVMKNIEGDNDYSASIYSGRLDRSIRYSGPAGLRAAAEAYATKIEKDDEVYPTDHVRRDIDSRSFPVGDRAGWLVRYELHFPQAKEDGWNFTEETAAFLLVERGSRNPPGVLYMSLPDSHRALGDLDLVLSSVRPL